MHRISNLLFPFIFILGFLLSSCAAPEVDNTPPVSKVEQPEWSKNANIYEINVRQYSEEGSIDKVREDLPRLKEMGVKILWLMPINPIGEVNRKGPLGSYYSVKDFKGFNPEFGSKDDFARFVDAAHNLDFKVIIDWVPNHTAWDNPWTENKDWYELDEDGNFMPPRGTDWTDVIQLDYSNKEVWEAMMDAMDYWVREFNIDGYRVDQAMRLPTDFWTQAVERMNGIKPVFMLAEDEQSELLVEAFNMNYTWEYMHLTRAIANGEKSFEELTKLMEKYQSEYPPSGYRMYFTTNHDENSWAGTEKDLYGANWENFTVLSATIDDMFLIYNGQESNLDKQLEFFERDPIEWKEYEYQPFFTMLLQLKEDNEALWNGQYGGDLNIYESPEQTYAYKRVKGDDWVFVYLNNSTESINVPLEDYEIPVDESSYEIYSEQLPPTTNNYFEVVPNSWLLIANE